MQYYSEQLNKERAIQAVHPDGENSENITVTSSSASSVSDYYGLVRLACTESLYYVIGDTATTTGVYLPVGSIEYVICSDPSKISAIRLDTDGILNISPVLGKE